MRHLSLFVLVLTAASCNQAVVAERSSPSATSGVTGQVLLGPICPVARESEPCPDQPYSATLVFVDGKGREVTALTSGEDGHFRAPLSPGEYQIRPQSPEDRPFPRGEVQSVAVEPGRWTEVVVRYDTGIR